MSRTPNTLTKDGLTGNSGFGVSPLFVHVAANYIAGRARPTKGKAKGKGETMCFVEYHPRGPDGKPDPVPTWKRMTVKRAKKEGRHIITCSLCRRPAISLDHYWPYYSDGNYCACHQEAVRNRFSPKSTAQAV